MANGKNFNLFLMDARQKIMILVDENNAINYVAIEKFIKAKEMNFIVNIIENLGGYNHE